MNTQAPLSALSASEVATVMDRLFQRMSMMYGSKLASMWEPLAGNIDAVKRQWATALSPFSAVQMKRALDHMEQGGQPFPPTLPEFVSLVRQFRDVGTDPKLPPPRETRSPEVAAKVAEMLSRLRGGKR